MGYDRRDSFPYDFEPNGIPFGSKSKGKLSPRSYPIPFERKWKYSFLGVCWYRLQGMDQPNGLPGISGNLMRTYVDLDMDLCMDLEVKLEIYWVSMTPLV